MKCNREVDYDGQIVVEMKKIQKMLVSRFERRVIVG